MQKVPFVLICCYSEMLFVLKKSQRYNVYVTLQNIFYAFLVFTPLRFMLLRIKRIYI